MDRLRVPIAAVAGFWFLAAIALLLALLLGLAFSLRAWPFILLAALLGLIFIEEASVQMTSCWLENDCLVVRRFGRQSSYPLRGLRRARFTLHWWIPRAELQFGSLVVTLPLTLVGWDELLADPALAMLERALQAPRWPWILAGSAAPRRREFLGRWSKLRRPLWPALVAALLGLGVGFLLRAYPLALEIGALALLLFWSLISRLRWWKR